MDTTDDSTAVVRIRRNLDDLLSSRRSTSFSRLDFGDVSDVGGVLHTDSFKNMDEKRHCQAELISARATVTQLQTKIDSLEMLNKEAKIQHERELEMIKKDHQKELGKAGEYKHQLHQMVKKYESAKQELTSVKKELDKMKVETTEKLNGTLSEKVGLQIEFEQMKQESMVKITELQNENQNLLMSLDLCSADLKSANDRLQTALRDNRELNQLRMDFEENRHQLSVAKQHAKELELSLSRIDEDMKVSKELKAQLAHLKECEKENKMLKEENQYLRAIQDNTLLLREQCESFQKKLERAEGRANRLSDVEAENQVLHKRLSAFESLDAYGSPLKSATQIGQRIADLQRNNELLLEKNGLLEMSLHKAEAKEKDLRSKLETIKCDLTKDQVKFQQAADMVKRLQRKLMLVTKEKEGFKSILDSYEGEITLSIDSGAVRKIRLLEDSLEGYKKQCAELEADVARLSDQSTQFKTKAFLYDQQIVQTQSKQQMAASSVDQNIVVELREKVAALEKKIELINEEKENLEGQIERRDMQGDYDCRKTKVLSFKMNPYSVAKHQQAKELDRLRTENEKLRAKIKVLEESGGAIEMEDLSTIANAKLLDHPSTSKEIEDLKGQLSSAELKNERLIEAFKKTSQEMREVSYKLLGYKIDLLAPGQYRLMSVYAESPNDHLVFKQLSNGELAIMANAYSESFADKVETYLRGADSLPAFMSSITLDLFSRQTMMQ